MPEPAAVREFRPLLRLFRVSLILSLWLVTPALSFGQEAGDGFADGDVLKITAYGREDLTGQYSVQTGPVLSLPLIGALKLGNWTARQLEAELAKAWENRLGSPMSVTVEFAQRAPFYVLGAVNAPGSYPYRSGLTVLQAVAVSGGIEKLKGSDGIRIDMIREREHRLQALDKLARATARKARLEAERDGRDRVTLEPPFTLISQDQMNGILLEESRLLDTRSRQYAIKEHLLSDQIRLGEAEIASYQRQLDTMEGQQGQITREASRIRRVPGQQVRVFELEQRGSTMETTKASIAASITRAKVAVETARSGIADLREARQREITEALLDAQQAIQEAEVTLSAAEDVLSSSEGSAAGDMLSFKILRNGKDEVQNAMSTTLLRPGDLLEVTFSPMAAAQQSATSR